MSVEPDMTFILTPVADTLSRHVFACVCLRVENLSHQLTCKAETDQLSDVNDCLYLIFSGMLHRNVI